MNKSFLCGIVAAAALSLANTASAGVVYNWHQLSSSPTISSSSGRLEVTNAAYRSGNLDVNYGDYGEEHAFPNGPLILFTFGTEPISPVDISRDGYSGFAEMSLRFTSDGLITGNLSANDYETDVYMSAIDGVWNIDQFNSDNPSTGCSDEGGCLGATGEWVLDPASVAVPEPGVLALFSFGLLGLAVAARKRRARS